MTLPLGDLSVDSLLQLMLELQDLIAQLKALRWSINMNLTHVIEFYEHLLQQAKADLRNALRQLVNHYWGVLPLEGPQWGE